MQDKQNEQRDPKATEPMFPTLGNKSKSTANAKGFILRTGPKSKSPPYPFQSQHASKDYQN